METDEILTVDEVAVYLKVAGATVRRWCRDGTLPALKIGHQYRVRAADLRALWSRTSGDAREGVGHLAEEGPAEQATPCPTRGDDAAAPGAVQ